jgi:hypothetical protein
MVYNPETDRQSHSATITHVIEATANIAQRLDRVAHSWT